MRRPVLLLSMSVIAALAAMPAGAQSASVRVENNRFEPATLQVAAGTTVTWTNTGGSTHSVTADDGSFDSHPNCPPLCMTANATFTRTFTEPLAVTYSCRVHGGAGMRGAIQVVAAATPTPASTPRIDTPRPTRTPRTPAPTSEPEIAPEPTDEGPLASAYPLGEEPAGIARRAARRGAGLPGWVWLMLIVGIFTGGGIVFWRVVRE